MRGTVKPLETPRDRRAYDPVVLWCRASRVPEPELEFVFASPRKWRFDYAWPRGSRLLALEQEGAAWLTGRHTRGKGFEADCEKYAEAAILGWTVLRATPEQIQNGTAFGWLTRIFQRPISEPAEAIPASVKTTKGGLVIP